MSQTQSRATLIGLIAIGFWAALAYLTVKSSPAPPFQLLAMSTAVAFVIGFVWLAFKGKTALKKLIQPPAAWLTAFIGIFVYHALYFYALSTVPAAQASLIAYFWPLLIVLMSGLLPGGEGLKKQYIIGAILGLMGVAFIFMDRNDANAEVINPLGYLAATACAFIWSSYSVSNRRYAEVPSEMIIGVCGAIAVVAWLAHMVFEETIVPQTRQILPIILLGIGPVGLAFVAWDYATKKGNLSLLGALSYLIPLLSTILLVITGLAAPSFWLLGGAVMIVAGAVYASRG